MYVRYYNCFFIMSKVKYTDGVLDEMCAVCVKVFYYEVFSVRM